MMDYQKITSAIVEELKTIFGANDVLLSPESLEKYSYDESSVNPHLPEVVVYAEHTDEVSRLMKLANHQRIPVVARGGGTCLTGSAIPIHGGIVLSLEKMNRILEIDEENSMVTVEPGVLISELHAETEKRGLIYPPDPGQSSSTIGGNVNTNAGGMKGVKYGVTRDFIEALEVVLPTGDILHLGGKTVKTSTGYSLINLVIGSEGTLGVVTQITLRVVPQPQMSVTLYVPFNNFEDAGQAVAEILKTKIVPPALEFVDQSSILVAERFLGRSMPHNSAPAYLLIRVDGNTRDEVDAAFESVGEICLNNNAIDVLVADTHESQNRIWEGRSCIIDAAKAESVIDVVDAVVPRNKIPKFLKGLNEVSKKYGVAMQNFGHAGDGNVHTNIIKGDLNEAEWRANIGKITEEIYQLSLSLGGNISGEHGIGIIRKNFLPTAIGEKQVALMKEIKRAFDPNNVMNPNKIFDL